MAVHVTCLQEDSHDSVMWSQLEIESFFLYRILETGSPQEAIPPWSESKRPECQGAQWGRQTNALVTLKIQGILDKRTGSPGEGNWQDTGIKIVGYEHLVVSERTWIGTWKSHEARELGLHDMIRYYFCLTGSLESVEEACRKRKRFRSQR